MTDVVELSANADIADSDKECVIEGGNEMYRNGATITETVGDREATIFYRGNGRNGYKDASQLLSWYLEQPRIKGLAYALTANGYMILPNGLPRSREEFNANELMM